MDRASGGSWSCVSIGSICQEANAKTTYRSECYYCTTHRHHAVKFEIGVVHRGPLDGLIVWLRGPDPANFSSSEIAKEANGILSQLEERERLTGRLACSSHEKTITPVRMKPKKWSAVEMECAKTFNEEVASQLAVIEAKKVCYSHFGICGQKFRHSKYKSDGPNFELLRHYWEIVTFVINRNTLDRAGQTRAWSIPSRPLRSVGWPGMAPGVSQAADDANGPVGPLRGRFPPQRTPIPQVAAQPVEEASAQPDG